MNHFFYIVYLFSLVLIASPLAAPTQLEAVNSIPEPDPAQTIAITGVRLIDGLGNPPVEQATVLIHGNRILAAGNSKEVSIPEKAHVVEAEGKTLMPGLIDSHYHLGKNASAPSSFLAHGVTSLRDPGAWMETYTPEIESGKTIPRLFLTGPHLDQFPPAYPHNSIVLRDAAETRHAVNRFIDNGASAIKVYFRLPLGLIRTVCKTAHARGVVVTAHLEIVDARDAIRAGVDGIEHITSFGSALIPFRDAEQWRQAMLNDNSYRRDGRYRMWSKIDLDSPQTQTLLDLIVEHDVFVSATLGTFERRPGDREVEAYQIKGFENMMKFTGMCKRHGARVTTGSHTWVPHAESGWAFQREMELLVESGLTPMESIVASTMENARFFKIDQRLGSITPGKIADLIVLDGNPLENIKAMYHVDRVMLNGKWVKPAQ